jgi:hypothetical protein
MSAVECTSLTVLALDQVDVIGPGEVEDTVRRRERNAVVSMVKLQIDAPARMALPATVWPVLYSTTIDPAQGHRKNRDTALSWSPLSC